MGNDLVGQPIGGTTPEIALKWLQHQIAERKSQVKRYQLDIDDLTNIQLPKLQAMILTKENEIRHLLSQLENNQTIDI